MIRPPEPTTPTRRSICGTTSCGTGAGGYGTRIRYGGNANVVDNFYASDGGDAARCADHLQGTAVGFPVLRRHDQYRPGLRRRQRQRRRREPEQSRNRVDSVRGGPRSPPRRRMSRRVSCATAQEHGRSIRSIRRYVSTVSLSGCVVGPLLTVTRSGTGTGTVTSNPRRHQLRRRLLAVVRRRHRRHADCGPGGRLRVSPAGPGTRIARTGS